MRFGPQKTLLYFILFRVIDSNLALPRVLAPPISTPWAMPTLMPGHYSTKSCRYCVMPWQANRLATPAWWYNHCPKASTIASGRRSEEHTSELQSRFDLVCRLLLEKKK